MALIALRQLDAERLSKEKWGDAEIWKEFVKKGVTADS